MYIIMVYFLCFEEVGNLILYTIKGLRLNVRPFFGVI